jgi:hypothetical protein
LDFWEGSMAVFVSRYPQKRVRAVKIFSDVQALEIIDALESLLADPEDHQRPTPSGSCGRSDGTDLLSPRMKPGCLHHYWMSTPQFN